MAAAPTTHSSWRLDKVAKPGWSGGTWTPPTPGISYISFSCVREKGRKVNYIASNLSNVTGKLHITVIGFGCGIEHDSVCLSGS